MRRGREGGAESTLDLLSAAAFLFVHRAWKPEILVMLLREVVTAVTCVQWNWSNRLGGVER